MFDVCRSAKDRIILIDFNPFGRLTSAKLFDWDELEELSEENKVNKENKYIKLLNYQSNS